MNVVLLAAGRGSRFLNQGFYIPKPLIIYKNRPLFWWAIMSAKSIACDVNLHIAVLKDHIIEFGIDAQILKLFPNSIIHVIEDITSGAAETAAIVSKKIKNNMPIAFLDTDLAFIFENSNFINEVNFKDYSGILCTFKSKSDKYSYVKFSPNGKITGTVEKVPVSSRAIAGFYIFKGASFYLNQFEKYSIDCTYTEMFLSGVFNALLESKQDVGEVYLKKHLSLGTPEELLLANSCEIKFFCQSNK
jgi:NDP-sugar pyrophosphorylase family protein